MTETEELMRTLQGTVGQQVEVRGKTVVVRAQIKGVTFDNGVACFTYAWAAKQKDGGRWERLGTDRTTHLLAAMKIRLQTQRLVVEAHPTKEAQDALTLVFYPVMDPDNLDPTHIQ